MAFKLARNQGQPGWGKKPSENAGFSSQPQDAKASRGCCNAPGEVEFTVDTPSQEMLQPPPTLSSQKRHRNGNCNASLEMGVYLGAPGPKTSTASKLKVLPSIMSAHLDGNCSILPELWQLWTGHLPLFRCSGRKVKATFLRRVDNVQEMSYFLRKKSPQVSDEPCPSIGNCRGAPSALIRVRAMDPIGHPTLLLT